MSTTIPLPKKTAVGQEIWYFRTKSITFQVQICVGILFKDVDRVGEGYCTYLCFGSGCSTQTLKSWSCFRPDEIGMTMKMLSLQHSLYFANVLFWNVQSDNLWWNSGSKLRLRKALMAHKFFVKIFSRFLKQNVYPFLDQIDMKTKPLRGQHMYLNNQLRGVLFSRPNWPENHTLKGGTHHQ